jgi:hypothetical protein
MTPVALNDYTSSVSSSTLEDCTKRSHHNSTYGQTESGYTDAVIGGTGNHEMDAVEAWGDHRSRVLLTCPTRSRDKVLERRLGLLPATGLEPAVLKRKQINNSHAYRGSNNAQD